MDSENRPRTLQEAIVYFSRPGAAREYLARLRWPSGPFCAGCGLTGDDVYFMASVERWKCRGCKAQWSVKVGTIMEDSPLPLDKWLCAIWMVANCKNGVSSYEISRALGVTQKSAWFMLHRIRLAMKAGGIDEPFSSGGPFEADETYVGGKISNKHTRIRKALGGRVNTSAKAIVMGILERGGRVRAKTVPDATGDTLRGEVRANLKPGSTIYTDSLPSYRGLEKTLLHDTVNHLETYVRGRVHTQGIENFWSLLKRTLNGTYVNAEPAHLDAYVDEQAFRFNERDRNDAGRHAMVAAAIGGKRLTYRQLIDSGTGSWL
ncbi:MAG: IS1595 family transposase [Thermoanaerobaculia bacterium]